MKTIKDTPEHSRPREKPLGKGAFALTDEELVAAILAHNHPSGDPKPSETHAKTHRQLTEAGKILGLRILDRIIIAKKKYFSFQEAGLIG
ncbi:MAG: JAB domain-containing protein [Candidatus Desulfaltia sp.]|nr:JAB domain-containing protein [Candidatus Desulfaltia sp.]